jgi:FKBP-type peptidyl-prolyl cis-trans isomerase FkpA
MRRLLVVFLFAGVAASSSAQVPQEQPASSSPTVEGAESRNTQPPISDGMPSDDEKAIYAVGVSLWKMLAPLELSPADVTSLERGLRDAANGTPTIAAAEATAKVAAWRRTRVQKSEDKFKALSASYLEDAAKQSGAVKKPSGLVFFDLQAGNGASPRPNDRVSVHYRGTLANGVEFDSSHRRKHPAQFALEKAIPCWTEGLQMMKVGGKARLVCPANLAYGDRGAPSRNPRRPGIPGGATLVFDVELFDVIAAAAAAPASSAGAGAASPAVSPP